jgi:hypothetical protein
MFGNKAMDPLRCTSNTCIICYDQFYQQHSLVGSTPGGLHESTMTRADDGSICSGTSGLLDKAGPYVCLETLWKI